MLRVTVIFFRKYLFARVYTYVDIRGPFNKFGRSISSRTALLSKHTVTAENQNYYEVVLPLLYITFHGLIFDVTL